MHSSSSTETSGTLAQDSQTLKDIVEISDQKTPAKAEQDHVKALKELMNGVDVESLSNEERDYLRSLGEELVALTKKADQDHLDKTSSAQLTIAPTGVVLTPSESANIPLPPTASGGGRVVD